MSIDHPGEHRAPVPQAPPVDSLLASGPSVRGHYLLDPATRLLLQRSVPGQGRRRFLWVGMVVLIGGIGYTSNGEELGPSLIYIAVFVAVMMAIWGVFRQRVNGLPSHWVSLELNDQGLHVVTQSADYPTAAVGPDGTAAATGVRSASSTDLAWDQFVSATRSNGCWVLQQTSKKFAVMPFSAFSDSDNLMVGEILARHGLSTF